MIFFQPCCTLLYGKIIEWFIFIFNFIATDKLRLAIAPWVLFTAVRRTLSQSRTEGFVMGNYDTVIWK